MARTGATRRNETGPLHTLFSRLQSYSQFGTDSTQAPDGRLTDSVIDALNLTDQPFRPPGGSVPYFYNDQLEALLDELETCVGAAETLVVLEGAPESGKTCTVAQLLERFYDGGHVFLSRGGPAISAESIIRSMLSAYRATTPQTLSECTDQLVDHIASHADLGATVILVVEDAERMASTELQQLLTEIDKLNSHTSEPISVLLSSTDTAENLLSGVRSEHTQSGRVDAFTLPRLDANETASYIATRLAAAGHEGDLPLDERELQVLSQNSNGLPGYVDRNAARVLNQRINRQRFQAILAPAQWWRATRQHLRWVVIGLTMLTLGLAIGSWNAEPSAIQSDTVIKPLSLPTDSPVEPIADANTASESTIRTAETRVEPVPEPVPVAEPTATSEPITPASEAVVETAQANTATTADTTETVDATVITDADTNTQLQLDAAVDTAAVETASVDTATVDTAAVETAAVDSSPVETVAADAANTAASTEPAATESNTDQQTAASTDSATVADAATQSTTNPEPPINDVLSGVISGEKWIARRDPNRFTVQLLAGADEAALRLYARRNGMTSMSAIYRTLRNGQPWFALVHGDFASAADARTAVATLPEVWQQNSPWIRKFDDVQKVIN